MTDWPEWNQDIERRRAMNALPSLPHWCEFGSPMADQMQRYATQAVEQATAPLRKRIAVLEARLAVIECARATIAKATPHNIKENS